MRAGWADVCKPAIRLCQGHGCEFVAGCPVLCSQAMKNRSACRLIRVMWDWDIATPHTLPRLAGPLFAGPAAQPSLSPPKLAQPVGEGPGIVSQRCPDPPITARSPAAAAVAAARASVPQPQAQGAWRSRQRRGASVSRP